MQKQFEIKGITRNLPGSVSEDFSCNEVVNLRNEDGVWRPTGNKGVVVSDNPLAAPGLKMYLHTTGDTQQMVGYANGAVGYFDFPDGTDGKLIVTTQRPVRFNAINNILVIFIEGDTQNAPSTQYALWKKDENGVGGYVLLPDLSFPKIAFSLKDQAAEDGGLSGKGLVTAAYQLSSGEYIKLAPVTLMDYGSGRSLLVGLRRFNDLVPEAWRGIISNVSIFSSTPTTGIELHNFNDYINSDGSTLYKVDEINSDNVNFYSSAKYKGVSLSGQVDPPQTLSIPETYGPGIRVPFNVSVEEEVLPSVVEFGSQSFGVFSENTAVDYSEYLFRKNSTGSVKVRIAVNFKFRVKSLTYPETIGSISLFLIRDLGSGKSEIISFDVPPGELSTSDGFSEMGVTCDQWVTLTNNGDYTLLAQCNLSEATSDNFIWGITPLTDYEFGYTDNASDSDTYYKLIVIPGVDELTEGKALDSESLINHDYFGQCDIGYNQRLFIGDITGRLCSAYSQQDYFDININIGNTVSYVTYLRTSDGEKIVVSSAPGIVAQNIYGGVIIWVPTLVTYPDARAYKTKLYVNINGISYFVREFALNANKRDNYAYCYVFAFGAVKPDDAIFPTTRLYDIISGVYPDIASVISFIPSDTAKENLPTERNTFRYIHTVAASLLDLPMFFANANFYEVGNRGIVGFSVNNMSIDASNFGIYPLFVFTKEGVYSLQLGTTSVVERVSPLSGDVCVNRDSISNIGHATVFAGKNGLMIIQGQRSQKITTLLEHYNANPLSGNKHFEAILTKYGINDVLSTAGIADFLLKAKMFLGYDKNELVITNEDYSYSYVYSFESKQIHKIRERFYSVFSDYPKAYGTDSTGQRIYVVSDDVYSDGQQQVFVQTNPFKLGTDDFEMLRRLNVRMRITDSPLMGAYLFVSNDTRNWAVVDGKEIAGTTSGFNYLSAPASVKYGILVIAGNIRMVGDYLTHVTAEYQQRYGNKVR